MTNEEILREFTSLPVEGQRQVADFILFLRQHYAGSPSAHRNDLPDLHTEGFIGMWQDRADMQDSSARVRHLRRQEWGE